MGIIASFLQTLEKINLLQYQDKALACDLGGAFSCTSVLNAWQSGVFGFPNSLMCLVFFALFTGVGLVGLFGGSVTRGVRLGMQAISLFMLGFGLWFLWQSTFVINALCILCMFCFAGLLAVNWGWLRLNAPDLPIGKRARAVLKRGIDSGADTFAWILLALIIATAMIVQFT